MDNFKLDKIVGLLERLITVTESSGDGGASSEPVEIIDPQIDHIKDVVLASLGKDCTVERYYQEGNAGVATGIKVFNSSIKYFGKLTLPAYDGVDTTTCTIWVFNSNIAVQQGIIGNAVGYEIIPSVELFLSGLYYASPFFWFDGYKITLLP